MTNETPATIEGAAVVQPNAASQLEAVQPETAQPEKLYVVGIDIGSTSAKVVVMKDRQILFSEVQPTGYSSVDACDRLMAAVEAAGYLRTACTVVATGYGRVAVADADKTVTEITCHGRGAAYLFGENGTVIDIGGQDTKVIELVRGKVAKFNMNDKCSAGTGKFLEVMANRMGLSQQEMSEFAASSTQDLTISSMCTVFAESEVISLIGRGTPREDIARAVIESVVAKVVPLSKGARAPYYLTGGLCENEYVIGRLSVHMGDAVTSCPEARFAGAIGAALSA